MRTLAITALFCGCAKPPPVVAVAEPAATEPEPEPEPEPELEALRAELDAIVLATGVDGLADELAARVAIDQRLRSSLDHGTDLAEQQPLLEQLVTADEANTARMQEVVAAWGWPTKSSCSPRCAFDAWLLVQHADRLPSFQREVLALMEPLAEQGEVDGKDYALLYDRVAVADGRPQRFGSQGFCAMDGSGDDWTPRPIEDEAGVDARREAMGLMPMAHYRALFDCGGKRAAADAAYKAKDWPLCAEETTTFARSKAGPAAATPWYNAACCASLAGDADAAFAALSEALAAGFDDAELLATDTDLDAIRADPRWAEVTPADQQAR